MTPLSAKRIEFNKALEPTRVGALSSAVADHVQLSRVAQLGRSA